jgi:hypothetical protein
MRQQAKEEMTSKGETPLEVQNLRLVEDDEHHYS